jgi:transcriptional regulator with XRE-family HTH domain
MPDAYLVGERIAYHRKRLGLSQVEFAGLVGRSESWVSQVERGVRSVDRMSVLQKVADVLSVPVSDLSGDDGDYPASAEDRPEAFDMIRAALTGHPALSSLLGAGPPPRISRHELDILRDQHARVWELVHGSRYAELAPLLAALITGLEMATRAEGSDDLKHQARELLTDTYQATAAAMAKLGEGDAAWVAADRAAITAEALNAPLSVAASMFRMGHVFLSLGQLAQAQQVAAATANALHPAISSKSARPEELSLYGACHLVLAVAAARDNDRGQAHQHLDEARATGQRLGEDRDDYGTEFGPANVAIHAVAIAVELGDAGHALDLAHGVNTSGLSPERQARYLIDLAAAHAMRRQIGEALHDLQEAERLTPEQTRTDRVARAVARDLLQLSGLRPRPELRELAERFGVLP